MSSRSRVCATAALLLCTLIPSAAVEARPCWQPPTAAPVTDPFRLPTCPWCAGNRGLEYGTTRGQPVRAVAAGHVTFARRVAGTVYVVVRHADGRRVTYGNLLGEMFDEGDPVVQGAVIGSAAGPLHLGVREGDRYVDPAPLIGRWVGRPRLVPVDGTPALPVPPARLRCDAR